MLGMANSRWNCALPIFGLLKISPEPDPGFDIGTLPIAFSLTTGSVTWTGTVARYRDRYECHVLTLAGFAGTPPVASGVFFAGHQCWSLGLGAQYPQVKFLMEGDTPSFPGLVANGLDAPEHPDWGGWGGRYELYTPRMRKWLAEPETRPLWTDAEDEVLGVDGNWHTSNKATLWRWRQACQNDFAARMDWTIKPVSQANHPPVAALGHAELLTARPGERVNLSARDSSDPDGNNLSYEWFYYPEAGSFAIESGRSGAPLAIEHAREAEGTFTVPTHFFHAGTIHVILAVTDDGSPALTRYRRVIITVP